MEAVGRERRLLFDAELSDWSGPTCSSSEFSHAAGYVVTPCGPRDRSIEAPNRMVKGPPSLVIDDFGFGE